MAAAPPRVVLSRRKKDGSSGTVRVEAAALVVVESTGVGRDEDGEEVVGERVGVVVGDVVGVIGNEGAILGSMEGESVVGDFVGGGSGSSTNRDVNEGPVLGIVDGEWLGTIVGCVRVGVCEGVVFGREL